MKNEKGNIIDEVIEHINKIKVASPSGHSGHRDRAIGKLHRLKSKMTKPSKEDIKNFKEKLKEYDENQYQRGYTSAILTMLNNEHDSFLCEKCLFTKEGEYHHPNMVGSVPDEKCKIASNDHIFDCWKEIVTKNNKDQQLP